MRVGLAGVVILSTSGGHFLASGPFLRMRGREIEGTAQVGKSRPARGTSPGVKIELDGALALRLRDGQ